VQKWLEAGFTSLVLSLCEHTNPEIACKALKVVKEICEDRADMENSQDALVACLERNEYVRTLSALINREATEDSEDTTQGALELLLLFSEKSKRLSVKVLHNDNLVD
jgi:hypothetical protein